MLGYSAIETKAPYLALQQNVFSFTLGNGVQRGRARKGRPEVPVTPNPL